MRGHLYALLTIFKESGILHTDAALVVSAREPETATPRDGSRAAFLHLVQAALDTADIM